MDVQTAFAVLGVDPGCSILAARGAYRASARMIHPDTSVGADPEAATAAMAELNAAWAVVRENYAAEAASPVSAKTTSAVPRRPAVPTWRIPGPGECESCGWAPAGAITLRHTTGLALFWLWQKRTWYVCSGCASAFCADAQARSFTRGWWGLFAPIANIVGIYRNAVALRGHRFRVGSRRSRAVDVVSPALSPPPTYSAWRRPAPLVAMFAAAALVVLLATGSLNRDLVAFSSGAPHSRIGECVTDQGASVDCVDPSAAWTLVRAENSAAACLRDTWPRTFYDRSSHQTYCAQSLTGGSGS